MRLKSFHAPSLTQALDQVREHFGQDAAILSTQEHGGGFTVTAAIDGQGSDQLAQAPARRDPSPTPARRRKSDIEPVPPHASATEAPEADEHEEIADALEHHRIPPGLSQRILKTVTGFAAAGKREVLAATLERLLAFDDFTGPGKLAPGQAHLLVGPCGAGKTATIAKLCALAKLRGVPTRIATLDFESAGAYEQIAAFAGVLDAPLDSVAKPKELAGLRQDAQEELLLVDTVGTNPFIQEEIIRCAENVAALGVRPTLVLPAGGDPVESAETALVFAELGAKRLIPTRMDACRRLGGVLSAAFAAELTLVAAGTSPMIGGGLSGLSSKSLADALISRAPAPFSFTCSQEHKAQ